MIRYHCACSCLKEDGDVKQLTTRVSVDFKNTFDTVVPFVHRIAYAYGELSYGISPSADAILVSVLKKGFMDDANGPAIASDTVWLIVSSIVEARAFCYFHDGLFWRWFHCFDFQWRRAASGPP